MITDQVVQYDVCQIIIIRDYYMTFSISALVLAETPISSSTAKL